MTRKTKNLRTIFVLSDSTGNLARHMVSAFLTQFPPDEFSLRWRTFITSGEKLDAVMEEIRDAPGIVLHAMVSGAFKAHLEKACAMIEVPCCDLTGPFVKFIARASGLRPLADSELLHRTDKKYFERISALEFTLSHDDGLGLETLHNADIILAGVSRTSKTPTSIYLAQLGFKVANVSLAIEVEPPAELLAVPTEKVVGLQIIPDQLVEIRERRKADLSMSAGDYSDVDHVTAELRWSRRLFSKYGWHVLDVSDQAVEETAARVMALLGLEQAQS